MVHYLGNANVLPLHVGEVATIKEPLLVQATALIVVLPNFLLRTFLQAVVVGLRLLKFMLFVFAHLTTWALVQVCTIAPLLIQLEKVLRICGVGRV